MAFVDAISALPQTINIWFGRHDDDWADRLSHRLTVIQLIIFAIMVTIAIIGMVTYCYVALHNGVVTMVSTEQVIAKPINCWVPAHFSGAWEDYSNSYCWIRNTYYVPWDEDIPRSVLERGRREIGYYQWVPLILMLQALCFHCPISIWRAISSRRGIDVNYIVETADLIQTEQDLDRREELQAFVVQLIHRYLGSNREHRGPCLECSAGRGRRLTAQLYCGCGTKFGNYMTLTYFFIKFLFLGNVVAQFFLLSRFLGQDFTTYGVFVVRSMLAGRDWSESYRFPRVTLCDMEVRRLGNIHRYTLQCALTMNVFNEKIYLYLWFWYIFLALVTLVGIVVWAIRMCLRDGRVGYVKKHLKTHDLDLKEDHRKLFRHFTDEYLRQDGVLVLHLVDVNTNRLVLQEVVGLLWQHYCKLPKSLKRLLRDFPDKRGRSRWDAV